MEKVTDMNKNVQRCLLLPVLLAAALAGCEVLFPFVPDRISRLFEDSGAGLVGRGVFSTIQVDPSSEDSAGPQLIATGDIDGDGLLDVASVWNESKPLQLHFQRRSGTSVSFETITLVGDFPITIASGVEIADMDGDGVQDVVLMIKETGLFARCRLSGEILDAQDVPAGVIMIYFGPSDAANMTNALAWDEVRLSQSDTAGAPPALPEIPETGGFTSMVLGDIDGQNGLDIVVAWNANDCEGGGNRVEYYTNPGPATARQSNAWAVINIDLDAPDVKWVDLADIDRDGDIDIIATYPRARGESVRWYRNPLIDIPDVFHLSNGTWQRGTIGQVPTGADVAKAGDIDGDGITDVVVRSTDGKIIVWFKGPRNPTTAPIRNVTWQVFTIAEFNERSPLALTLADVNGDAGLDVVTSAEGGVLWLGAFTPESVTDHWDENLIFDDKNGSTPTLTDPNVNPDEVTTGGTIINELEVVDLDGDGLMDVIGTMDRRDQSGLTNDAVIWFRNNGR